MRKLGGQVAFEYMIIVATVLVFLVPIWAYVSGIQMQAGAELSLSYAKNTAEQIADTAGLVYTQGPPAKVDMRVYIPSGVEDINIINRTVVLRVRTTAGVSDVFSISIAEMNGTIPTQEGTYIVTIEAMDGFVQISS